MPILVVRCSMQWPSAINAGGRPARWSSLSNLGVTYLFDFASAVGAAQEDRTVAAWAVTPSAVVKGDISYQRGFPLPPDPDGTPVDRGHLIPHLSGGEFGPNIFRQHRALNRGWSEQGKRFRALEREAALLDVFYYGHLLYETTPPIPQSSRVDYSATPNCT